MRALIEVIRAAVETVVILAFLAVVVLVWVATP